MARVNLDALKHLEEVKSDETIILENGGIIVFGWKEVIQIVPLDSDEEKELNEMTILLEGV